MGPKPLLVILILSNLACGAKANAPTPNTLIDLTVPASPEPQTDSYVFDESVVFSPNFAINQKDPALSDLFSQDGVSNLCFPTSLAEALIDLFTYHTPRFDYLSLSGLSTDHRNIDPNALIRQLTTLCKTDLNTGTDSLNAISCVKTILSQSGYALGGTQLISPFNNSTTLPIASRQVTIKDIRDALKNGDPVLLEVAWFQFDQVTKTWKQHSGHYVSVYGYDYNLSWGENQIQIKVINPETSYPSTRQYSLWDTITIEKFSPQPGITYPANRTFILSGAGFGGLTKRGFLGMMITLDPQ